MLRNKEGQAAGIPEAEEVSNNIARREQGEQSVANRTHLKNFQQDNAQPHTARVTQDCFCTVTTLPRPARSPNLSPIKHIWDNLGQRVGHPTSLNELEVRLQRKWNKMSQGIIQNLYA
ncbi:transposable element Tcb2 transposase [Trichonephila clavipes]|nr:transposable element Tcb2 transposase [Trichonephila clavipes]